MSNIILKVLSLVLLVLDFGNSKCPTKISRGRWGARASQQVDYQPFPIPNVIVSHTVTSRCKTQAECARVYPTYKPSIWTPSITVILVISSFMIGGDGNIYQGRGWIQEGAHTVGWNSRSLGIAFIGNFEDSPASVEEMTALRSLLDCGVEKGFLSDDFKLFGQRQLQATLSPGFALYQQLQDIPAWSEIV